MSLVKKIFYSRIWEKRLCPYPFNRLEIGVENDFVPCCRDWLNLNQLPKHTNTLEWNGEQAKLIRQSMYDGNFKYCQREKCHAVTFSFWQLVLVSFLGRFTSKFPYYSLSLKTLMDIAFKKTSLSEGPRHITYTADFACNLKCPSCRTHHVGNETSHLSQKKFNDFFILSKNAETILFSGGEALYSEKSLAFLRALDSHTHPKLKSVTLMTNGLLFNKVMWQSLGNSRKLIRRLMVSIDAGTEEHYQLVRGGSWKQLLENLSLVKELRLKGELDFVSWQFVPRKDNFRSMNEFVTLSEKFSVDRILFQTFCQWEQSSLNYNEQAVHLKNHPENEEFQKLAFLVKKRPKVTWAISST